ncbi:Concanavalin A-like lectin/glucanase, subgroup [Artemisia annua]|uniref:Concanavalin A-like lectin/glucanase, subgroup n=1 Tax=Artemisia annua TaxID=35608 RepID=A0A2U1QJ88_ARTAN|nr:Concanavalin A-like lectin/glucanase, subgroup [Artemisia annua]
MASQDWVFLVFLVFVVFISSLSQTILGLPPTESPAPSNENPFTCSKQSKPCKSILYLNNDLPETNISLLYSVGISQIQTVVLEGNQDYLVTVPCSCQNVSNTVAYFYDTLYLVKDHDTFFDVSSEYYSGQAWPTGNESASFQPNMNVTMHLLCGCAETDSQVMVTYTVQEHDTLSDIANRLSAEVDEIQSVNKALIQKPGSIDSGWVLFIPMYKNGRPSQKLKKGKNHKWMIIFGVLLAIIALLLCVSIIMFVMRKRSQKQDMEKAKVVTQTMSYRRSVPTHTRYLSKENMEGITGFDTERPLVYDLDEIAEATNNFDETRIIGEGGYGSVYFGILGEKEVAIKKMRSNKSKEFLAELKVLCKIHHINVVELLGFASGDDHLYLVYEFVSNGSLNEHLHDPLLKGHQPLSWTARAQIALDAAKGIEYIHDHTKERYVHRDIKTSNILLDNGLRAKVADFGLAKLVGRTNDDDFIATRLVGTPGYLPPESVKELHVTTKTDVFAFGVVLAELITGKRALMRDNREPSKMKSLITVITKVFEEEEDPEGALVSVIDGSLKDSYPMDDLYKMAEISYWCLSEDPNNRPEIREVVESLARIVMSSVEWEASLGGSSQVFSGVFDGR